MSHSISCGTIYLKNLRMHAYHGVLPQERTVGNDYVLSVSVNYPLQEACHTDNLTHTINYAEVLDIVKREMSVKSNLLEHVAQRICTTVLNTFPLVSSVSIDLMKVAPPMAMDADGAGVSFEMLRSEK